MTPPCLTLQGQGNHLTGVWCAFMANWTQGKGCLRHSYPLSGPDRPRWIRMFQQPRFFCSRCRFLGETVLDNLYQKLFEMEQELGFKTHQDITRELFSFSFSDCIMEGESCMLSGMRPDWTMWLRFSSGYWTSTFLYLSLKSNIFFKHLQAEFVSVCIQQAHLFFKNLLFVYFKMSLLCITMTVSIITHF